MAEFFSTQRGGVQLVYEGHGYVKKRERNGVVCWDCHQKRPRQCNAHVYTLDNEVVDVVGQHSHDADPALPIKLGVQEHVKDRAAETRDAPEVVVADTMERMQLAAVNGISIPALKRSIKRVRQDEAPVLPQTLDELQIPDDYQVTPRGDEFLLDDDGVGNDRILLFATNRNLQLLGNSPQWLADGTFSTVPGLFAQLYTIHGVVAENAVPLVYALLPNKTALTYQRMWNLLRANGIPLNRQNIMFDFEQAAIAAALRVWPNVDIHCCIFHLCQSVHRHMRENGLLQQYRNEPEFSLKTSMIPAFAFLPEDEVEAAVNELFDYIPENLVPLLRYFEHTYIGTLGQDGRADPRYPVALWSCFDRVRGNLPRSNNIVEGWNNRFTTFVGCRHANIWKFLEAVQKEQSMAEVTIEQAFAGAAPRRRKTATIADIRLNRIVRRFNVNVNKMDYLRGAAHNVHQIS